MGSRAIFWTFMPLMVLALSWVSAGVSDKVENDFFENPEVTLNLWHYYGDEEANETSYSQRGSVDVKSFKGPKFNANQNDLTEDDIQQIDKLAKSDGYYFIKATVKTSSGDKTFKSFASAKSMLESGLSDMFRVHVDPNGDVVAVGYSLTRHDFFSNPHGVTKKPPKRFNSTVFIHYGELGPQPDTAPYLEKLENERLAKERGEDPRDNRSFLAKYWMYIVPIAIMVLLSGASNPEEGGGGR